MTHARKFVARFASPALLAMSALFLTAGCGNTEPNSGDASSRATGTVGLELALANGKTLDTVTYTITGPGGFSKTGSIDVSHSSTVSTTIGAIPAGSGYTLSLSGASTDSSTACSGSATF